jgi:hypothetical protein
MSESDCPRNLTNIQCGENPVNRRSAQDFQMFSTSGKTYRENPGSGGCGRAAGKKQIPHDETVRNDKAFSGRSKTARNSMGPSAWLKKSRIAPDFGACPSGRQKLRKDPSLEVPCFEGTLRKVATATFPNHIPWPGQFESLTPSQCFRCRTATRVATKMPG